MIDIIINVVILLFLFNLWLCFKTENLFSAQFDELENVYKITQKTLARGSSFDWIGISLI